jgi:TrmH family RNA methyltransferase
MQFRLKRYKKDFDHSYTFGVYPTLEMLLHWPEAALGVVLHPKGTTNEGIRKIKTLCEKHQITYEMQAKTFNRIGARDNDYAIGVFNKIEPQLDPTRDHVILVHPAGVGNLGTIIRTMLGFNFYNLAIIQPGADIFHPNVVRASMGSLFQLNFARFDGFEQYNAIYEREFYPLMTDGVIDLMEIQFKSPFGLIFGNESSGLPETFRSIGTSVRIKQSDHIDSLNIAISVGITLYEANKKAR